MVMLNGLDTDCGGDMRLARAGAADQDYIVGVIEELAAMELARERFVDLAAGESRNRSGRCRLESVRP